MRKAFDILYYRTLTDGLTKRKFHNNRIVLQPVLTLKLPKYNCFSKFIRAKTFNKQPWPDIFWPHHRHRKLFVIAPQEIVPRLFQRTCTAWLLCVSFGIDAAFVFWAGNCHDVGNESSGRIVAIVAWRLGHPAKVAVIISADAEPGKKTICDFLPPGFLFTYLLPPPLGQLNIDFSMTLQRHVLVLFMAVS